ncbi:MAG TPA: hypothetical protein VJX92_19295 [Methylomirabilota bacterium]|nr:hypothetical protein [Methylomirabilota bacterium]
MGPKDKLTFRYVLTLTTLPNLRRQLQVPPHEFGLVLGAIAEAQDHQEGGVTA